MAVGGAPIARLFVRLGIEDSDFKRGAREAKTGTREMRQEMQNLSSAGNDLTGILRGVGVVGAAYMGKQALQAAWDMGRLGAQSKDVTRNLQAFAGGAKDASMFMQSVIDAADGGVDRMIASATATKLLQMGLADTTQQMSLYIEGADRLGAQNLTTGQRIEEMTQLLKNQNVNMLDNFGLSKQIVLARTEELKATQGLTREQAMLQAIQEEIARQLDILGPRAEGGAKAYDKLEVSVRNLKLAVAELAEEPVTGVVNDMAEGVNAFTFALNEGTPALQAFYTQAQRGTSLQDFAAAMGASNEAVKQGTEEIDGWLAAMHGLPEVVDEATIAMGNFASVFEGINSLLAAPERLKGLVPEPYLRAMDMIGQEQDRITDQFIRDAVLKGRAEQDAADDARRAWEESIDAQKRARQELESLVQSALKPTDVSAWDVYTTSIDQYVEKWDEASRRLDAIAQGGFAEIEAHPDWIDILRIPPEILQANEEVLKEWASRVSTAVRNLERPDLLNIDAAVEMVRQEMERRAAVEMSIDLVANAAIEAGIVGGADARQQVAEALGLEEAVPVNLSLAANAGDDLLQSLGAEDLGIEAGGQLLAGVDAALSTSDAIAKFTVHLQGEVSHNFGGFRRVGESAGQIIGDGMLAALGNINFLLRVARMVAPEVANEIAANDEYGGEY